tara:strand:+ start:1318 stop:3036 length:1719 start_codon:yes stop_codon:yes gene_type:complete
MRHFLNGVQVTPRNILTIGVESDFTDRPEFLNVDTEKLVLPREAVPIIQQHLATYGPFEGIPYQMILAGGETLEYYVDLQSDPIFRDYEIEVKIKKRGGIDNFFDRAEGTTWELMAKKGVTFDKFDIPYLILPDDVVATAIGLGVSIYVLTNAVIDQVIALSETITALIDSVTPEIATPTISIDPAEVATLVVKALLQIAVLVLTLVALLKMIQQFFELLFPKVRYLQGMKVKRLLEQGCNYLGYQFSSTLLDGISGLTICPVPLVKAKDSFWDYLQNDLNFAYTKGYPSASDTTPSLDTLLRAMETTFNARTRVRDGLVELEIRNYWQDISPNQIVPALNIQDDRQNQYTLNTADIWKRTYIHYNVDFSDLYTVDFYDPTDAEYSTEPVLVNIPELVTIKGLNEVIIPFALGVRKNNLNWLEDFAKGFFELADEVLTIFGGNGNYTGQIEARIGVMKLSQQFFSTSKLMYTVGGKQPTNYASLLRASTIYENYHQINEIQVNDYKIFEDVPVRMTGEEFISLLDNNYANINGQICEILTIKFKDEETLATISYKQPDDWANGKTTVLTINS